MNQIRLDWMGEAACIGHDLQTFFPSGGDSNEAREVCMGCPVAAECLEYALAHHDDNGIWGGTTERVRRRLIRHPDTTPKEIAS